MKWECLETPKFQSPKRWMTAVNFNDLIYVYGTDKNKEDELWAFNIST